MSNLANLRAVLASALPLLVANRDLARKEWMDGALARGAFHYVQGRLDSASMVLENMNLTEDQAFHACSLITLDLRSAIGSPSEQKDHPIMVQWLECFTQAGYTDVNFFDCPAKPDQQTEILVPGGVGPVHLQFL